jgi:hypothetical protein
MIWIIARKELLANLLTLRLSVALVCVVVLSALTVFIGSRSKKSTDNSTRRRSGRRWGHTSFCPLVLWLSSVRVFLDQILLGGSTGDKDQQHRQERTPGA